MLKSIKLCEDCITYNTTLFHTPVNGVLIEIVNVASECEFALHEPVSRHLQVAATGVN